MEEVLRKKGIVIFDGVCNLCNASIDFIMTHDKNNYFLFAPNQSKKGKELLAQYGLKADKIDTVYLIENNNIYSYSTAFLRIAKEFSYPWKNIYGFIIVPRFMRDVIYRIIAYNRYKWFGKRNSCRVPTEEEKERFLS